jgi:hippurate hydrolase
MIESRMKKIAEHVCAAHDATVEFSFHRNYPSTINHESETAFTRNVLTQMVGAENVKQQEPTMGAEDFSYFLQELPGTYFFIGNGQGAHREMGHGAGPCTLHNPSYDFNDDLIPLGGTVWVRMVESFFSKK